jgi:hypothetical protein
VTATGQNLKRLLQKRGWGRRPFPAEAAALAPPAYSETDAFPRNTLLKSHSVSVAAASLILFRTTRKDVETQTSWFSPVIVVHIILLSFSVKMHFYFFLLIFSSPGKSLRSQAHVLSCKLNKAFLNRLGRFFYSSVHRNGCLTTSNCQENTTPNGSWPLLVLVAKSIFMLSCQRIQAQSGRDF